MNITQLRNDILFKLVKNLEEQSKLELALILKTMFDRIAQLPQYQPFNMYAKTHVGSLFFYSIRFVRLHINVDEINYDNIAGQMDKLVGLQKVDIISISPILLSIASKLLNCLASFHDRIVISVPGNSTESFKAALAKNVNVHITLTNVNPIDL
jgi:hypothetical protein